MTSIVLKEVGQQKSTVIEIVREATGLALKEVEDAVNAVDSGVPFRLQISSEKANQILTELLSAGAVVTGDKLDEDVKNQNHQDENTKMTYSTVEPMNREQTMQTLQEVGRIAKAYEDLTAEQVELTKQIKTEKDKAEELRKAVSAKANAIRWLAILGSFVLITKFVSFFLGIIVAIVVAIIMDKTVIKQDLIEHEEENNANADRHLREVVMPLEKRLQKVNFELDELMESGKIEWAKDIVGEGMFHSDCIDNLYYLVKNRRADTIKEALNLYDDIQYKARMEASQEAIQNAAEITAVESIKQTKYAKETAENSRDAANAAEAAAYHAKQINKNTRRFR